MAWDVLVKNGTLIDGTGAPGARDLAIDGDRITAIGKIDGNAPLEIDAEGKLVTPGFVDIHTHLDAQIAWDPIASSSCYHGVTSVVLGNCGVTFAPCKPEDRDYPREVDGIGRRHSGREHLERAGVGLGNVRRVPRVMSRMQNGVNVGGMVGHCAVRYHAMGERGLDDVAASADDIARMCDLVRRSDRRRRARLLDVAHVHAPRAGWAPGAWHLSHGATNCSRSAACSANIAAACSRPCPTSTARTRT